MAEHSMISPSSAHRWMECPASVRLSVIRPLPDDSPQAREGTAAHWVLSQLLTGKPVGEKDPSGEPITDEMLEGAATAYGALVGAINTKREFHVETQLAMTRIRPECYGTPDIWQYIPEIHTLTVVDYKFGWGLVEIAKNWQLLLYVAGILDYLRIDNTSDQSLKVNLVVVQPRPYHPDGKIRTWSCLGSDLRGYFNQLTAKADEAMGPNPTAKTGAHCATCLGRHACSTLSRLAGTCIEIAQTGELPLDATPQEQGRELVVLEDAIEALKARRSGIYAAIEQHVRAGVPVPGWGMTPTYGWAKWNVPDAQVLALGQLYGADLSKPVEPITPAKARALNVISPEVLASMTVKPEGHKLARVTTSDLQRIFRNV